MAIGNITQIYPSTIKYTSSMFSLDKDVIKVQVIGLQETDCVCVETVIGSTECDERWVPYNPDCCGQLCFGYPQGQFFLNVPGRYRLVLSNRLGNELTDPSWFSNVEIYQTPVDGKNINLSEGCGSMGCSQKIQCSPDGILIDGILCPSSDTFVTNVNESANGWMIIQNDGSTFDITLESSDGSIDISGGDIKINVQNLADVICADSDAKEALKLCLAADGEDLATAICASPQGTDILTDCLVDNGIVCQGISDLPISSTMIGD